MLFIAVHQKVVSNWSFLLSSNIFWCNGPAWEAKSGRRQSTDILLKQFVAIANICVLVWIRKPT